MEHLSRSSVEEGASLTAGAVPLLYLFGPYTLSATDQTLRRQGIVVPLPPMVLRTLLVLVQAGGELVTRESLLDQVWGSTYVDPNSISQNILKLRKTLDPDFPGGAVATVPKRGYRFLLEVTLQEVPTASRNVPPASLEVGASSLPQMPKDELPETIPADRPLVPATLTRHGTAEKPVSRLLWLALACMCLLAITGLLLWRRDRPSVKLQSVPAQKRRPAVAILGFQNLTGGTDAKRTDWIGTALEETMFSEMSADPAVRIIPNGAVYATRTSLKLDRITTLPNSSLQELRASLGCDLLLVGHYLASNGKVRVDLELQDAHTGEVVGDYRQTENQEQLLRLISESGQALRTQLGMPTLTPDQQNSLRAGQAEDAEALRAYAQGLLRLKEQDPATAVPMFQQAIAIQPDYTLAYVGLSRAYMGMGYDVKSQAASQHAYELSGKLGNEDRLQVEAQYAETAGRWEDVVALNRRLVTLVPDEIRYKLQLANALIAAGKPYEALQITAAMQRLPPPDGSDPRILLAEARAHRAAGDFAQQANAADAALQQAQAHRQPLLAVTALLLAGDAMDHMGQHGGARMRFAEARTLLKDENAPALYLEVLRLDANAQRQMGDLAGARAELTEAINRARMVSDHRNLIAALSVLTQIYRREEDLPALKKISLQILENTREIGDRRGEAAVLLDLGNEELNMGDPVAARKTYDSSLKLAQEIDAKELVSRAIGNLGVLDYTHGRLVSGKALIEQGILLSRSLGEMASVAYKLGHYTTILMYEGKLQEARSSLDERCALLQKLGQVQDLGSCQLAYADLSQQAGNASSAVPLLQAVTAQYQTINPALLAWISLARAKLALGDVPGADAAVQRATALAKGTVNEQDFLIPLAIERGIVQAQSGRIDAALSSLMWARKRSHALGLQPEEWQARIALARIDALRNPEEARRELRSIALSARQADYLSIADLALLPAHDRAVLRAGARSPFVTVPHRKS